MEEGVRLTILPGRKLFARCNLDKNRCINF